MNPATTHPADQNERRVALVVVWRARDGRPEVLVTRRAERVHLGGMWEFPGGKVEPGETPAQAAIRELAEETDLRIDESQLSFLQEVAHQYPDRSVRLIGFLAEASCDAHVRHLGVADHDWVELDRLASIPLPVANRPITEAAIDRLRRLLTQASGDR